MRLWTRYVDGQRCFVVYDDCSPAVKIAVGAALALDKLCILPDGCIAEPVEVFDGVDGQVNAFARMANEQRAHPHEAYTVVMNAD